MALKHVTPLLACTAGIVLAASPVLAAGPNTVSVDGDSSGAMYPYTAVSEGSVTYGLTGVPIVCSSVVFSGYITTGTGSPFATITNWTSTGCSGGVVTPELASPWQIDLLSGATSGTDDIITGEITGVDFHIDLAAPLGDCGFEETGSVGTTFREDDGAGGQQLDLDPGPGLSISDIDNVLTCAGLINNGDAGTVDGTFNVMVSDPVTGQPIPGLPINVS